MSFFLLVSIFYSAHIPETMEPGYLTLIMLYLSFYVLGFTLG